MQTRSSDENSVLPSIRRSVKRVHCDKREERSVQISILYERSFSLLSEKNGRWGRPRLNFGSIGPSWSEIVDFEPIFALSGTSAVRPSEKKFN